MLDSSSNPCSDIRLRRGLVAIISGLEKTRHSSPLQYSSPLRCFVFYPHECNATLLLDYHRSILCNFQLVFCYTFPIYIFMKHRYFSCLLLCQGLRFLPSMAFFVREELQQQAGLIKSDFQLSVQLNKANREKNILRQVEEEGNYNPWLDFCFSTHQVWEKTKNTRMSRQIM